MEGAKVYVPAGEVWQKASVVAALGGGHYRVQLEPWEDEANRGQKLDVVEVDASKMEGGTLPFQNANMPVNGFPNMTNLDHLHEAALLHNLRVRFFHGGCPYTYTADIVIAMNPYRWFPHLYTEEIRKEYFVFDKTKLQPHVYAASSASYHGLCDTASDQSILVSGESGAGKTETVKILMAHLALIASSEDSSHIRRIVESNPLLEAFGNAQTVRNDNSSRFGKFIALQMDGGFKLVGSHCQTFLLEKSRVVGQDAGERNYHVFYQMLAADEAMRASIGLNKASHRRDSLRYACLGASKTAAIEGVSDADRFKMTLEALALVGVVDAELTQLLRALAGVLLLGQVEFGAREDDGSAFLPDTSAAEADDAAAALDVDAATLTAALTKRTMQLRGETIVKVLEVPVALATRDALAKELYARLFDWLVGRICAATGSPDGTSGRFVGLLDIFGFESFTVNRFEQLCINYANEKLQQKFTLDVFKAVQQEYETEGIPVSRIEFQDNAPVLALIESRMGVVAMLNEECVRPKGSDENFVSKLVTVHKADPAFSVPRIGAQKELQFTIRHYAAAVTYTTTGWLERNKDTMSEDVLSLMGSSRSPLIAEIFAVGKREDSSSSKQSKSGDSVITKFKTSLAQLMSMIGQSTTQYVRCIKPNKNKSPAEVDDVMVSQQLRCAGVVEAIRLSRAGFQDRMPLEECLRRFGILVRALTSPGFAWYRARVSVRKDTRPTEARAAAASLAGCDTAAACRKLIAALLPEDDGFEVGRTRVYFKGSVLESLEEERAVLQQLAGGEIARHFRGYKVRGQYTQMRALALRLQGLARMQIRRKAYKRLLLSIVLFQSFRRRVLAKRRQQELRRNRAVIRLQSYWRGYRAAREFSRARWSAVRIQSVAKRRRCRRKYLEHLAESREQAKLENQVKQLQSKLAAAMAAQIPSDSSVGSEREVDALDTLNSITAENTKLRAENEKLRAERDELRRENQQLRNDEARYQDQLNSIKRDSARRGPCVDGGLPPTEGSRQLTGNAVARSKDSQRAVGSTSTSYSRRRTGAKFWNFADAVPLEGAKVGDAPVFFDPLSEFWDDVPHPVLPLMTSGAVIHLKFGANIIFVDDNRNLRWKRLDTSSGYRQSMALVIETAATSRSPAARAQAEAAEEPCNLGPVFVLKSAVTGRYVQTGGMLQQYLSDRGEFAARASKIEDATSFTFVPLTDSLLGEHSSFACGVRLAGTRAMLRLSRDGSVTTFQDIERRRLDCYAAVFEQLLPRSSYEISINEDELGLVLSVDRPPRVLGFKPLSNGRDGTLECSGRVQPGDALRSIGGRDITDIDAVALMAACSRPVTISFDVGSRSQAEPTALTSKPSGSTKREEKKGMNLLRQWVGRRSVQAASLAPSRLQDDPHRSKAS